MIELGERSDGCKESWGLRSLHAGDTTELLVTASGEPEGGHTQWGAECGGDSGDSCTSLTNSHFPVSPRLSSHRHPASHSRRYPRWKSHVVRQRHVYPEWRADVSNNVALLGCGGLQVGRGD